MNAYPRAKIRDRAASLSPCPKCGDGVPPLKQFKHRMTCDGTSSIIRSARPGRVKSLTMTTPGHVLTCEDQIEWRNAMEHAGNLKRPGEAIEKAIQDLKVRADVVRGKVPVS